jgi:hypothetical protein
MGTPPTQPGVQVLFGRMPLDEMEHVKTMLGSVSERWRDASPIRALSVYSGSFRRAAQVKVAAGYRKVTVEALVFELRVVATTQTA